MTTQRSVPQFKSFVGPEDYARLAPVFENHHIAEGPFAAEFAERLLAMTGAPYGVHASNGTLALYLALRALGIGPGDEVIVQNVTFIASANAVEMTGATPVFIDVPSFNDLTIDLESVQVTESTKAIMVAHLFGTACSNIEAVADFCRAHGLRLVEDSAQALGITNGLTHCGLYGDVGTLSFYADKTITTAEGGFVMTSSEELHETMVLMRNQGRARSGTFVHPAIGYNFRINDLQAALGLAQLDKFDRIVSAKAHIAERYRECLGDKVEYLIVRSDFSYIPFRVVVFVDDAERTIAFMRDRGIEPRTVFYPLHRQPCYSHLPSATKSFPNSVACYTKGICLPTWVGLSDDDIEYTTDALLASLEG